MRPRPSFEKALRTLVASEVRRALAPYLELAGRVEKLLAPRSARRRPRRRAPLPAVSAWDMHVLKCLATDLQRLDLALAMRVQARKLDPILRGLYDKLGVADEADPRAAAVRLYRALRRAPLPPQPVPLAVDQLVRVPQLRGTAEATILAIDPGTGDLTVELVEDGRVFKVAASKVSRRSA